MSLQRIGGRARPAEQAADVGYNFMVHAIDASFFGLAIGLASWITIIPLFLNGYTESALLVGMIASIQPMGWHLPQLLTAGRVSRLSRLMPMVLRMTVIERIPFFLLAGLALSASWLSPSQVIGATYLLVAIIGIGGGLTATPFQALVGKIIPNRRHGIFYGAKTAAANLLLALGAVLAGRLLDARPGDLGFALCFGLAGLATVASWGFLALTREPAAQPPLGREPGSSLPEGKAATRGRCDAQALAPPERGSPSGPPRAGEILRRDASFRRFLLARNLAQVTTMAAAYYTLYAIRRFDASAELLGWMTALFAAAQTLGNPLLGWAGDRWGHVSAMRLGLLAGSLGALCALLATDLRWLFGAYFLTGLANVAAFTLPLAMNLRFGDLAERPIYIGLSSSLTAPSILLAPLLGGWMVGRFGFASAFGLAVAGGIGASLCLKPAMGRSDAGARSSGDRRP